jgi:ubiquinone/menaquinone biosynthesis C-methylase UbiE
MTNNRNSKWPKVFPDLSPEQVAISNDFMQYWHEVLPKKYGIVDEFNHSFPAKTAPSNFIKTLEIGAGNGEHLKYERLSDLQKKNYVAVDIRKNMIDEFQLNHPTIQAKVADCQIKMDFRDGEFDRILAIHVLEHLPNLPEAIKELHRLCNKEKGVLQIVIPCEGSLAYTLARKISAQRIFESRYKQSYKWLIEREHINMPWEIFEELEKYFLIQSSQYFPVPLKYQFCNLCIGANFTPLF